MESIFFWVFATVAVAASLLVVGQRNPMHSVLLLITSFGALAGLYVLLDAPFVAAIQIIIYAGAIMVLFLFVVMLLNVPTEEPPTGYHARLLGGAGPRRFGAVLSAVLVLELAWALSSDRSRVPVRVLVWGVGLQLALGVLLLGTPFRDWFFAAMDFVIASIDRTTEVGARFVFGDGLYDVGFSFALHVLPVIVVMGSVFAVLYHLGIMQWIVAVLGGLVARSMGSTNRSWPRSTFLSRYISSISSSRSTSGTSSGK